MKPTLAEALAANRLSDFAAQAEGGRRPANRANFDKMVRHIIALLLEKQTSHLSAGDCSHGK